MVGRGLIMQSQIRIGRIFGIRIGIHYSWFIIALLIVLSLTGQFRQMNAGWTGESIFLMAVITGVLFFVTLLLHELAHSLVIKSYGVPVREITLFALGGVSQILGNPPSAISEFLMAFVGPLTSACIGAICLGIAHSLAAVTPVYAMLSWLGYINLGLAVFNLVPTYPLDGGRVLRALLWWGTGDASKATRWAARTGQVAGVILIALGLVEYFTQAVFSGLWLAFLGWFIVQAASESNVEAGLRQALRGVAVGDVITPECRVVAENMNLDHFIQYELIPTGAHCFIIVDDQGQVIGLVTPRDLRHVERSQWAHTPLTAIMRPFPKLKTVTPDTPLITALEMMAANDVNQLPVVSKTGFGGVISRGQLMQYLQRRPAMQA